MRRINIQIESRVAILYAVFGGLWILFSDSLLNILVPDLILYARLQTYKGWLFVAASALLIYSLVRQETARRNETLEKLRDSEEALRRFELLAEHSRDIILFMRRDDGRILEANAAALQAYGYSHEELLQCTVRDLRAQGTLALTTDQMAQADNGGILFETVHRRKDGSTFPVEVSSQGATIHGMRTLVSIVRDITDRHLAEENLRKREAEIRSLYESMTELFVLHEIVYNPSGQAIDYRILECNPAFEKSTGIPRSIAAGGLASEVYGTGEAPYLDIYATVAMTGEPTEFEVDFSPLKRQFHISAFSPEKGYFATLASDITERKQAEEALRHTAEELDRRTRELNAILSSVQEYVYIFDLEGRFIFANKNLLDLLEMTSEQIIGKTMRDLNYPQPVEITLLENIRQVQETGQPVTSIMHYNRPTGAPGIYENILTPMLDSQGQISFVAGSSRDITERKRAEDELIRTLEELRHSNAELEQFAYVASHDLQEPLRGIAGLAQLMQQRYQGQLDSRADEYITHIVEGTQRMQTLINDLLAYSRIGRRELIQSNSSEAALKATLQNLNAAIKEYEANITYESLPTVRADATQLIQLFQNLIGNAIKFRSQRPPHIHIGVVDAGACWQFSVQDNGIGIEPQYFERIFQVFQRLHTLREYKGTGIGLAICKKIVERHGGKIWVESQPGQGSTFYFTLQKGERP